MSQNPSSISSQDCHHQTTPPCSPLTGSIVCMSIDNETPQHPMSVQNIPTFMEEPITTPTKPTTPCTSAGGSDEDVEIELTHHQRKYDMRPQANETCFSRVYAYIEEWVVAPCLVEDESYAIRSRKLAVLCLAVMMSNALTMGLPMTVVIGVYDPNYGSFVLAAAMLHMFVFSSVVPYVYLRRTREMPQWMVDLQVWSTLPTLVAASLFMHQVSIPVVCVVVAMVAIMLRARLWWVFMLIMLGLILFTRLVVDFASELPALHSTFYREQLLVERITYTLGCSLCPPAFMCLGLYVVVQQFVQRSEEADAAIHMNLAVAAKLAQNVKAFDTDGIGKIIDHYAERVDEKLLRAFTSIHQHLEEFRSHIPDYVIAAAADETEDNDGEDVDGEETEGVEEDEGSINFQNTISTNPSQMVQNVFQLGGESVLLVSSFRIPAGEGSMTNNSQNQQARRESDEGDILLSNSLSRDGDPKHFSVAAISTSFDPTVHTLGASLSAGAVYRPLLPRHPSSSFQGHGVSGNRGSWSAMGASASDLPAVALSAPQKGDGNKNLSFTHSASTQSNSRRIVTGKTNNGTKSSGATHFSGRATTVFIRFVTSCCGSDGRGDGSISRGSHAAAVQVITRCTTAAGTAAKSHGGAMQYMQGCGLMVSFNAASRTSAHETKACSFVLALKTAIDELGVVMHATVVTSPIISFFAGNRGQLMLSVLGGFMSHHAAMHYYLNQTIGPTLSCILLCQHASAAAEMHYHVRRLGLVRVGKLQDVLSGNPQAPPNEPVLDSTTVSQLLAAKEETAADEWMYQLANQHKSNPHAAVNGTVDAALSGRLDDAQKSTLTFDLSDPQDMVLHRCVLQRIAACIEHQRDFAMTAVVTPLW